MSDDPNQTGTNNLTQAAVVAVLAASIAAGIPLAANQWRALSLNNRQAALSDSHMSEAARWVGKRNYQLANIGYAKARQAATLDPAVLQASEHLLVLSAVQSPRLLTGAVLAETEYTVERALRRPGKLQHREFYLAARGAVHATQGRIDEALAAFDEAAELTPDFARVRYFRGKVLADRGRSEEAATELKAALALDPNNALALKRLARLRVDGGQLAAAAFLLAKAIDLGADADAHYLMGLVKDKQRKHEAALANFLKVGQIRPKHPGLEKSLGLTLYKLKRWQEAIRLLQSVFQKSQDITIYYFIGRSYLELGDKQRAANIFKTIVDNRPNHAEATYDLAHLLDKAGQASQARAFYNAFLKIVDTAKRKDLAEQERFARQRREQLRKALTGGK